MRPHAQGFAPAATTLTIELSMYKLQASKVQSTQVENWVRREGQIRKAYKREALPKEY